MIVKVSILFFLLVLYSSQQCVDGEIHNPPDTNVCGEDADENLKCNDFDNGCKGATSDRFVFSSCFGGGDESCSGLCKTDSSCNPNLNGAAQCGRSNSCNKVDGQDEGECSNKRGHSKKKAKKAKKAKKEERLMDNCGSIN